jgi:hypothetical protein
MLETVSLARRSTWSHAFVGNQMILLTAAFPHTVVMKYVQRYLTAVITTVKKNAIQEAVLHAIRHLRLKRPVLVVNTISKCSLVIHNSERVAQTLFLYVECLVARSYNVGTRVLEVATRELALIAK